jgi:hypothetical protein
MAEGSTPNLTAGAMRVRVAVWAVLMIVLVAGVVLYFRLAPQIVPMVESVR